MNEHKFIFKGQNGELLALFDYNDLNTNYLCFPQKTELSIIWFLEDNCKMKIDTFPYTFGKGNVLFLTEFNKIESYELASFRSFRFNHSFYCVISRDEEVSCKGNLFYGAQQLPMLQLSSQESERLEILWKMFQMEMNFCDETQLEMLQMMIRRILLIFNRIYKQQNDFNSIKTEQIDLIREFNFLVETHFKEIHNVEKYAYFLSKSPKTLTNLFKKVGYNSPLQLIQNRIQLEARRLLSYTNVSVSEIAYELGYADVQTFSRFFKKQTGFSPTDFRIKYKAVL